LHFAATDWAAANLFAEGVPADRVAVTGNTGIDAVLYVRDRLEQGNCTAWIGLSSTPPASSSWSPLTAARVLEKDLSISARARAPG